MGPRFSLHFSVPAVDGDRTLSKFNAYHENEEVINGDMTAGWSNQKMVCLGPTTGDDSGSSGVGVQEITANNCVVRWGKIR